MNEGAREVLQALWEATPDPPQASSDPSEVIERARQMTEARAAHIAALQKLMAGGLKMDVEQQALMKSVQERDERWAALLQCARNTVAARLTALSRIRR